jgi:hypothetical protein
LRKDGEGDNNADYQQDDRQDPGEQDPLTRKSHIVVTAPRDREGRDERSKREKADAIPVTVVLGSSTVPDVDPSATPAITVKNHHHQYSERDATPLKSAYLPKTVLIAVKKSIDFPFMGDSRTTQS